ncbi:unnamed protein product [Spirodela intermedia]|uniref:Uncharacterized protein n=1 Tax=Spirodela intermedia TaxID=51605 RepID=A0A7I8IMG7_SPIIN|nr:unnamed protein product [Spirodela intermedia]CAA6658740.1 unnamed protein product [Spirodela intermedia]
MANKGVAALRQFTRCKGKTGGGTLRATPAWESWRGSSTTPIVLQRSLWFAGSRGRRRHDARGSAAPRERNSRPLCRRRSSNPPPLPLMEAGFPSPRCRGEWIRLPSRALSTLPCPLGDFRQGTAAHSFPFDGLRGLPRIAVAGAKPSFFASHMKEEPIGETIPLRKIQEWRPDRQIWIHRMKRKAAISWQSLRKHSTLAAAGAPACEESKPKVDREILILSMELEAGSFFRLGRETINTELSFSALFQF